MTYKVRIYCHTSFEVGTCEHVPKHPFTLPDLFDSIRAANDHGGKYIVQFHDDEIEWEVIDETGEIVC